MKRACSGPTTAGLVTAASSASVSEETSWVVGGMPDGYDAQSGCTDADGRGILYLDRHSMECDAGFAIRKFHFARGDCTGPSMKFHYVCARIPAPALPPPPAPFLSLPASST